MQTKSATETEQNTSQNAPLATDQPTRGLVATNLANQPSFHQKSLGPKPANNNQQTTNYQTSIKESDIYRFCVPKTASVDMEQGKWDDLYINPSQRTNEEKKGPDGLQCYPNIY